MRPRRLFLASLIAIALAPGTWLRTPEPSDFDRLARIVPLAVDAARSGPFELVAAWRMSGDPVQFGGLSALVALDGTHFLAGSDTGRWLRFTRPDRSGLAPGEIAPLFADEDTIKESRDLESLAVDPAHGIVWGGFEYRNSVMRFDAALEPNGEVRPPAMRRWDDNAGPETLVRLADGRFLAIAEGSRRWRGQHHRALVFAGDPVEGARAERVVVEIPKGYRPVDATPAGDGRALVLLRRVIWGLPPGFATAIAEIDIDDRAPDGTIAARLLAEFGARIPQDNYEGIALTEDPDGTHVWLVSDDNFMVFQRTILLKLLWRAREKARE